MWVQRGGETPTIKIWKDLLKIKKDSCKTKIWPSNGRNTRKKDVPLFEDEYNFTFLYYTYTSCKTLQIIAPFPFKHQEGLLKGVTIELQA